MPFLRFFNVYLRTDNVQLYVTDVAIRSEFNVGVRRLGVSQTVSAVSPSDAHSVRGNTNEKLVASVRSSRVDFQQSGCIWSRQRRVMEGATIVRKDLNI